AMAKQRTILATQPGQQPLRFAQRIRKQHAALPALTISAPPVAHVLEHPALLRPAIDRKSIRRFRDEGVAANGLKSRARRVRIELVIARNHPDLAFVFDTDLCGPEHMPRRMEGNVDLTDTPSHAVSRCFESAFAAKPRTQHRCGEGGRKPGV